MENAVKQQQETHSNNTHCLVYDANAVGFTANYV